MSAFIKYYLERMMKLKEKINEEGFVFSKFEPNLDIYNEILNTEEPNDKIKNFFRKAIGNFGIIPGNLHTVYEDITLGLFHELHTHLIQADFQVVVWAPQDNYEGRAYVYGTRGNLKKFYPKYGDMVFMKTNDLNFIHGVEPLENDTLVRTMLLSVNYTGTDGKHLTVSADDYRSI